MKYLFFILLVTLYTVHWTQGAVCGCALCGRRPQFQQLRNPNVEVIYQGDPCPCQRALPYEIQVPLENAPERRQSYEYQVIAPPLPSPPPQRYIYNYQLQVPIEKPPQRRLNGLLARLDRVVLPAPDCRSVNPALATDSNSQLLSNGNDLTPIQGGYVSRPIYSSGNFYAGNSGVAQGFISGAGLGSITTSNVGTIQPGVYSNINVLNGAAFDSDDSISFRECNGIGSSRIEELGQYYSSSSSNEENDYYSRYARDTHFRRDEDEDFDLDSSAYVEANVPYVPDSHNLDSFRIHNSEYTILEEVPESQQRRNNDDETDYNDEETDYRKEYSGSDEEDDYSDEANDYLSQIYQTSNRNPSPSLPNQEIDTNLLYQLYMDYLNQGGESVEGGRQRRSADVHATTDDPNLMDFVNYLENHDCSVPTESKSTTTVDDENSTEPTPTDYTTTSDYNTPVMVTTTERPSDSKFAHLNDLIRIFEKYNQLKASQTNPVTIQKFLMNYPIASKLLNSLDKYGGRKVKKNSNYLIPIEEKNIVVDSTEYFPPPQCPTIANLLKHPKYTTREIADTGILQFLPELTPQVEQTPQERIYDINGLNIGAPRLPRSYAVSMPTNPKPVFGMRFPKGGIAGLNSKTRKIQPALTYPNAIFKSPMEASRLQSERDSQKDHTSDMSAEMPQIMDSFTSRNTNAMEMFDTKMYETKMSENLSAKDNPTNLYEAIDLKQKLREIQKQNMDEDLQLYKHYLQIPATQKTTDKYSHYFRIPQFERLSIDQTPLHDVTKFERPEIYNPKVHNDEDDTEPKLSDIERQHLKPIFATATPTKFKRHFQDYTVPMKFKRNLDNFEEDASINVSGESSEASNERYERTISYILGKLKNSRLLNYVRRKYNERLARRLSSVARSMDLLNTLNTVSNTGTSNFEFERNYGGYSNVYNSQYASDKFYNVQNTNRLRSKPKIVYDHLGHKYIEVNGYRRLIKPNIDDVHLSNTVEIQRPPCVQQVGIVTGQNECSSKQRQQYQSNLDSEIIVETNDILQKVEPVYKTETIEIIKPEQHYYYPEEKYIIQKTEIDQYPRVDESIEVTQDIQLSEDIEPPCNQQEVIVEEPLRRPCGNNIDITITLPKQQQDDVVIENNREVVQTIEQQQHFQPEQKTYEIVQTIEQQQQQHFQPQQKTYEIVQSIEQQQQQHFQPEQKTYEIVQTIEEQPQIYQEQQQITNEIIENQQQPQNEQIIIQQTIEQQPQQSVESANVEIKEITKKYQIPYSQTCQTGCLHPHHHIKQLHQHIDVLDQAHHEQEQEAIVSQEATSSSTSSSASTSKIGEVINKNVLNEYQQLAALQNYFNILQLLQQQNHHHQIGSNDQQYQQQQQLVANGLLPITSVHNPLTHLLLGRLQNTPPQTIPKILDIYKNQQGQIESKQTLTETSNNLLNNLQQQQQYVIPSSTRNLGLHKQNSIVQTIQSNEQNELNVHKPNLNLDQFNSVLNNLHTSKTSNLDSNVLHTKNNLGNLGSFVLPRNSLLTTTNGNVAGTTTSLLGNLGQLGVVNPNTGSALNFNVQSNKQSNYQQHNYQKQFNSNSNRHLINGYVKRQTETDQKS